jgi:hypothetical protein
MRNWVAILRPLRAKESDAFKNRKKSDEKNRTSFFLRSRSDPDFAGCLVAQRRIRATREGIAPSCCWGVAKTRGAQSSVPTA